MMFKILYIFLLYWGVLEVTNGTEITSPPKIVKQPPSEEIFYKVSADDYGKPFYIECEAEGNPPPKYRWVKNGKPFVFQTYDNRITQLPGRGTLAIAKLKDEDVGQYQCFAENEYGIATSNSVFLQKAELHNFNSTKIISMSGNEGDPFKLTCHPPYGRPKPALHWVLLYDTGAFKVIKNSRITIDPEGGLWFSNLTRQDETDNFVYACAAASMTSLEYKIGDRVKVQVRSSNVSSEHNKHPPTKQYFSRKNEVVVRGKSVELYCIYGGTPLPQTTWSKNGNPIQFNDRITQEKYGKSLLIKAVDFDDEGLYSCHVSNGIGDTDRATFNLKVISVPYFTVEPQISTAKEGDSVEFQCNASGVPEPDIEWIHNGKPISEAPPNPRRIVNKTSIVITNLQKNDTGNYGCNATNSLGYVYKDVYVNVLTLAPEIIEAPRDEYARIGEAVKMTCRVFGIPSPLVKWSLKEKELSGERYTVLENGDLSISNVQFKDTGEYTCHAENKFGEISASFKLVVSQHTYITKGPEDLEITAGQEATFRCNAFTNEKLTLEIIWERQGTPIDFGAEPRFVQSSDSSTMTVYSTTALDSGTYTCRAKTKLDEVSAQAVLIVHDVPNAPRMLGVTCNELHATIMWIPMGDNHSPILNYIIEYNTSSTPDTWEIAQNSVPAIATSYTVPLSPGANYAFRVIARNEVGLSLPSAQSTVCTTLPQEPHTYTTKTAIDKASAQADLAIQDVPNAPEILSVTCNELDATVRWIPRGDNGSPILNYIIQYNTRFTPDTWEVAQNSVPAIATSYTVPLSPGANYAFRVIARNEVGLSLPSAQSTVCTTLPQEPYTYTTKTAIDKASAQVDLAIQDVPNAPEILSVICNELDATVRWIPRGDNGSPILNYIIQYNTRFTPDTWEVAQNSVPSIATSYTVPLSPGANYTFRVIARNEVGLSLPSAQTTVCTTLPQEPYTYTTKTAIDKASAQVDVAIQDVPNAPEILSVTCNELDATVRWIPRGDNGSPILNYIIQYNTRFTPDTWEVAQNSVPAIATSYTVPLSPGANYTFRVIARNEVGLSLPSAQTTVCTTLPQEPYTYTTKTAIDKASAQVDLAIQDVPNAPEILSVTCNELDATVRWIPRGDNGSPILNYIIQYNTRFTPDTWEVAQNSVPAIASSYTVPLSPGANYAFRVIARNEVGLSLPSAQSTVCTTLPQVPYKNPDNVEGEGDQPDNLVIKWSPMPEIDHKENQVSFKQYLIRVTAVKSEYKANVSSDEVIVYSGEHIPTEASSNFSNGK